MLIYYLLDRTIDRKIEEQLCLCLPKQLPPADVIASRQLFSVSRHIITEHVVVT